MPSFEYQRAPELVDALQYTGTTQSANECVTFGAPDVTYADGVLTAPSTLGPYVMVDGDYIARTAADAPVLAFPQSNFEALFMRYTGPPVGETQPA
jgi:hypothetical protein